jgi:hypothetical protein
MKATTASPAILAGHILSYPSVNNMINTKRIASIRSTVPNHFARRHSLTTACEGGVVLLLEVHEEVDASDRQEGTEGR